MTNKLMISWCIFCIAYISQPSEFEQRWQDLHKGDVLAWAEHITGQDTDDLTSWDDFKSVAVIPGYKKYCGDVRLDDEVWVIVERTIDGNDYKIVEQFQPLDWGDDADYCWFVDCAPIEDVNLSTQDVEVARQIGDYPTLRTTTAQADPGLPHEIEIATFEDLEKIGVNVNYPLDGHYYQTADIDASETQSDLYDHPDPLYGTPGHWLPIGKGYQEYGFYGTYDGCGFAIDGLSVEYGGDGRGLFGRLSGECTIANLTLTNVRVEAGDAAGGLVGHVDPDYAETVGGIANTAGDIVIQNCHVSGFVKDRNLATEGSYGGLIGTIIGSANYNVYVYDCSSSCTIYAGNYSSNSYYYGGLVGYATYCNIYNCYATGDVGFGLRTYNPQVQQIGGFIGLATNGTKIEYCYATGDVEGTDLVGGFVGSFYDTTGTGYIRKSYATGDVTIEKGGGGGTDGGGFYGKIAGTTPEISDCYAWGNVTVSNSSAGGFGGATDVSGGGGEVNQVYSIGTVTCSGTKGGLVATALGVTWTDTYWDTEASGEATSGAGEGQETDWLKCKLGFPDTWDYDLIWYNTCTEAYTIEGSDVGNPYKGDEVCVYADGIPLGVYSLSSTDASDIVGIDESAYSVIIAGLNYYSIFESFPMNLGDYSAIKDVKIDFHKSMGCHVGVGIDDSVDWIFSYDDFATSIEPLTEIKKAPFLWGTTREPIVYIWEWEPIPLQVRSIYPRVDTTRD